eukprot:gene7558-7766_t
MREAELAGNKIGTTKRGIGPAYASKSTRNGLRVHDLFRQEDNPSIGGIVTGLGLAPNTFEAIIGVVRETGREYGTTTGRPRRVGWLDIVALKYVCKINGFTHLNLTKLDVLSDLPEIKVGVGYKLPNGKVLSSSIPADIHDLEQVEVQYETLPGWQTDISNVRQWEDLPEAAKQYVLRVEELVGVPIKWIGEGSAYDATKDTVDKGNSPFGAAILANQPEDGYPLLHADANKVQTAGTPTAHGEISTINSYFSKYPDASQRVPPSDTIFLSTHQPCSMCSSGLAFGGFRRVFYGFDFGMQVNGGEGAGDILDVTVIEEVFNTECGLINHTNGMYTIVPVRAMLLMQPCDANATIAVALKAAQARYAGIVEKYKQLGRTFQERMSAAGGASDVQLMASACTGCAPFPRPACPQEIL